MYVLYLFYSKKCYLIHKNQLHKPNHNSNETSYIFFAIIQIVIFNLKIDTFIENVGSSI